MNTNPLLDNSEQLIVVLTENNTTIHGQLERFEKKDGKWISALAPHPVTIGRTGLAQGLGDFNAKGSLEKKEGDGKAPAGIFSFGKAFGYAPESEVKDLFKMEYIHISETTQCIEDGASSYYNQIIDNQKVKKDWEQADFMQRKDDLYKWGIFVNHNVPAKADKGSCIFMHLWPGPDRHTAGCTAMTEENMFDILKWLDPAKHPKLVQFSKVDYETFKTMFKLP